LQIEDDASYEREIVLRSLRQTVTPTLVSDDASLFDGLLADIFPESLAAGYGDEAEFTQAIHAVCAKKNLIPSDSFVEAHSPSLFFCSSH